MKNIKNLFSALLMMMLTAASSFALTGLLAEQKSLKCFRTQYFDIVFPECSEEFATEIAKNADKIYEDICNDYGIAPTFHLPVTITPDMEIFNAYASSFYKKHIVLFDTMMPYIGTVDEESMLGVFKHELTHVVTYNMTGPFFKVIQTLFGDTYTMGMLKLTTTFNEGASIASESRNGFGRLNDGFYLHQIRQLKLQNEFPNWESAMGNFDDRFYNGINYSLGGPFIEYLQNAYGMEKYKQFNYSLVNGFSIYENSCAKKVYGKSLSVLWKEFYDTVKVYDVPSNPLAEDFVHDFFSGDRNSEKFDIKNLRGSNYSNICLTENSLIYRDDSDIYLSRLNSDKNFSDPKEILGIKNIRKISASSDGRYIAIELKDENHVAFKKALWIYDVDAEKVFKTGISGCADPVILNRDGKNVLSLVKYENQKVFLDYYNMVLDAKGNLKSVDLADSVSVAEKTMIYDLVATGSDNQKVAAICIDNAIGVQWSVRVYDGTNYTEYLLPENYRARDLKYNKCNNSVSFSYVTKETLPRLAYISLDENSLYLMDRDISGGVYEPVIASDRVIYSGRFVTNARLLEMDLDKLSFVRQDISVSDGVQSPRMEFVADENFVATDYNGYSSILLTPFIMSGIVFNFDGTSEKISPGLGGSLILSDSWDSLAHIFSAGWEPLENYGVLGYTFEISPNKFGMDFSLTNSSTITFNLEGFKQVSNYFFANNFYSIGRRSRVFFSEKNECFYGKRAIISSASWNMKSLADKCFEGDDTDYYFDKNTFSVGFDTAHTCFDVSYISKIGGSVGAAAEGNVAGVPAGNAIDFAYSHSLSPSFGIHIPRLIPVDNIQGYCYNLPLKASVSITPNEYNLAAAGASVRLFGMDVQKGIPGFIPLYIYRFHFDLGYDCYLYHRNRDFAFASAIYDWGDIGLKDYADKYSLLLNIEFGTYAGCFANSGFNFIIGAGLSYSNMPDNIMSSPNATHEPKFVWGFSSNFGL